MIKIQKQKNEIDPIVTKAVEKYYRDEGGRKPCPKKSSREEPDELPFGIVRLRGKRGNHVRTYGYGSRKVFVARVSKATLRYRQWTDGMVRDMLGEPDDWAINPHYRTGPEMGLYDLDRVEAIEQTPEFGERLARVANRRLSGKKAAETKRQLMHSYVDNLVISVPKWDWDRLTTAAVEHFNQLQIERNNDYWATTDSDEEFLDRIRVNFLRHELTSYEQELWKIAGKFGANEARYLIKEKVLDAIREAYPQLEMECSSQEDRGYRALLIAASGN